MAHEQRRPHVLVIDDAPAVLHLLRELLEEAEYRVSIHPEADENLDEIKLLAPNLVILDFVWRGQNAGWSLLRLLRRDLDTAHIPVVLCTTATREVETVGGRLAEMGVRVVLKPFDIDQLLRIVREAIALDGAAGQPVEEALPRVHQRFTPVHRRVYPCL